MSNTAFALSPIAARATSPTEADFEAIREAFVETARGRWFLEEYTKRNRNADTALVLDAVARIERTLAAQKDLRAEEPPAEPAPDLTETLAAIKTIIATARNSAEAALSGASMDEALAPTRKCARVIREIAWGLRESGADGRICSLLDSQVDAINAACDRIPTSDFRDQVLETFDRAAVQIDQLGAPEDGVAEIDQPDTTITADEVQNTSSEIVEETLNVSADVSNDNSPSGLSLAAESSLTEGAASPSLDVPTEMAADTQSAPVEDGVPVEATDEVTQASLQPVMAVEADAQEDLTPAVQATETADFTAPPTAASEHMSYETVASEAATSEDENAEDPASDASAGVALDESLFDLSADTTAQATSETGVSIAEQDARSVDAMEPSAPLEASTDVAVDTAAVEEDSQQAATASEPEIATSELEQNPAESISPSVTVDEITAVPQVVESLEAMADIAIEETAYDEALPDQDSASETVTVVAKDQLPGADAPQIAEVERASTEPLAIAEAVVAAESHAELDTTSDAAPQAPSEDVPSIVVDEAPGVSAKTPLPDNMLGEPVAQDPYSVASLDMAAAVEAAPAIVTNRMMMLAAGPTPDAITPPISLGASLIASGIVAKPEPVRNDPLAAIRRMSHAERIAFFS